MLPQYFHTNSSLSGDYISIVIRMDEGKLEFLLQLQRMQIGIRIRIAMQYCFCATAGNRLHLNLRRGHWHNDDSLAAQFLRRQRHTLRVITRRGSDDTAFKLRRRQLRHFVISAAQLKRKYRLHVFPF